MSKHREYIFVRIKRPEGYEDVCDDLVLADTGINPAFEPKVCGVDLLEALIAAAPELLEALQDIVNNGYGTQAINKARAAIAKATGENND